MTRVALVTGGTRGIGLGIARALAADGWSLALCGVRPAAEIGGVVSELQKSGGDVHYIAADLSDRKDRHRLVDEVRTRFGAVHALVNNAGRAPRLRADCSTRAKTALKRSARTSRACIS
jgi:NAD(P)-dependent dehydrogenase (short-subunit alcohol dehydrogenase family)